MGLICSLRSDLNPNNRRASFVSLCGFMVITSCKVFITLLEVFHFLHGFW